MSVPSNRPLTLSALARLADDLRAEAVVIGQDANRAEARGFLVLGTDMWTLRSRLVNLAARLDETVNGVDRPGRSS